jgi:hypothetical protein
MTNSAFDNSSGNEFVNWIDSPDSRSIIHKSAGWLGLLNVVTIRFASDVSLIPLWIPFPI